MFCTLGQVGKEFTYYPGGQGSIPGRVIAKSQKMALNAALLNTQHYKVLINDKVK